MLLFNHNRNPSGHHPPPLPPGDKKNYWSLKSAPIIFLFIIGALANTYQINKIKIITPLSFCFSNEHTRDGEYTFVYDICWNVYLMSWNEFHSSRDIRREFVKLLYGYFSWNFFPFQIIIIICLPSTSFQKPKKISVRDKLQNNKGWFCKKTMTF